MNSLAEPTVSEFLSALLRPAPPGAVAWCAQFAADPEQARPGDWTGAACALDAPLHLNGANGYVSIAVFPPGALARNLKTALGAAVVLCDDVGQKTSPEEMVRMLGEPSFKVQTSPTSQQWGYLLERLATAAELKPIHARLRQLELCDKNGNNLVRYGRLPAGVNSKRKYGPQPFAVHPVPGAWHPERRFSAQKILEKLSTHTSAEPRRETDAELIEQLRQGDARHGPLQQLAARYAGRGWKREVILQQLQAHMSADEVRAGHWQAHYDDIPRIADSALEKFAPDEANEFIGCDPRTIDDLKAVDKSTLILPNRYVPYPLAARRIFALMGERHELFSRGGGVVEVATETDEETGVTTRKLQLVTPDALRTRLDRRRRVKHFVAPDKKSDELVLTLTRCSRDTAAALLTEEPGRCLPRIALMAAAPVLIEHRGQLLCLGAGYHPEGGGVFVLAGGAPPRVTLEEAVTALLGLLVDFQFTAPADRSRAVAGMVMPALRMGKLLFGHALFDVAESDASQAGKGFKKECDRAIYAEEAYVVARRAGGVGSLDESIAHAFVAGRPFIILENVRGPLHSEYLEAALTNRRRIGARIPGHAEVDVDISRMIFQLTSNGVELTVDAANRALVTRILKQPGSYTFKQWPEGGLLQHVMARQPYYLGCVHAVIRAWHAAGKPQLPTTHSFKEYVGALDWIAQRLFRLPPLLEGHTRTLERISNKAMSWLRAIAIKVVNDRTTAGKALSASALAELAEEDEATGVPGVKDPDKVHIVIGKHMYKCFGEENELLLDEMRVRRTEIEWYDKANRKPRGMWLYQFWREGMSAPEPPARRAEEEPAEM